MTRRWLAEWLDRAFIELCIRPTLPAVRSGSKFTRLSLAEERTRIGLTDTALFPAMFTPKSTITRSRALGEGGRVLTLCWPAQSVSLETDWFSNNQPSRQAMSRWYLRDTPRPLVVLVSGWSPIGSLSERLLWPIRQLDQAGYDVAVPILAANAGGSSSTARSTFPGRDPSRNIVELVRRAATVEQVLRLGHELGHDPILVWGNSLGAHIVALLITLRARAYVSLYVLEKPVSRLSEPIRLHGRGTNDSRHEIADRLDQVYRGVSPLDRLSRVDPKQVLVIGGKFDKVTPIAGAKLLARHFNAPLRQIKASHVFDPTHSGRLLEVVKAQRVC